MDLPDCPPGTEGYQDPVTKVAQKKILIDENSTKAEQEFQEHLNVLKIKLENGETRCMVDQRGRDISGKWIYLCYPCAAMCSGESILQSHISGKKHKTKLAMRNIWPMSIFTDHPYILSEKGASSSKTGGATEKILQKMAEEVDLHNENPDELDIKYNKYRARRCHIEDNIDYINARLVGPEYVVEHPPEEAHHEPAYTCTLCYHKLLLRSPRAILKHMTSFRHRCTYINRHFNKASSLLRPYRSEPKYLKGVEIIMNRLAQRIEDKFGRKRPVNIDKKVYEKDRERILQWIFKSPHFSESRGQTFEELVDVHMITSLHQSEIDPDNKAVRKNRDPSPPTVAPPTQPRFNAFKRSAGRQERRAASLESLSDISDDQAPRRPNERDDRGPIRNKLELKPRHAPYADRRREPSPPPRSRYAAEDESGDKKKKKKKKNKRPKSMSDYKVRLAHEKRKKAEESSKKTLAYHKKNPEKHPLYPEEWKNFWNRRYKEIEAEGKDPSKHDFKPEWIVYWTSRMKELHEEELRNNVMEIYRKMCLSPPDMSRRSVEPLSASRQEYKRVHSDDGLSPSNSDNDIDSLGSLPEARSPVRKRKRERSHTSSGAEPQDLGPADDVVATLRMLVALEDYLGSLGPKIVDLLTDALKMEKDRANSSGELLERESCVVLIETAKEKLKGAVQAGLVAQAAAQAVRTAVVRAAATLHEADTRAKRRQKSGLKPAVAAPVPVAGVGEVDRSQIAQQMAAALIAQGKTDVSSEELAQLVDSVVGITEAKKREAEVKRKVEERALAEKASRPTPAPAPAGQTTHTSIGLRDVGITEAKKREVEVKRKVEERALAEKASRPTPAPAPAGQTSHTSIGLRDVGMAQAMKREAEVKRKVEARALAEKASRPTPAPAPAPAPAQALSGTASALQMLQSAYDENDKNCEKEVPDAMDGLSDSDLETLLKNFNDLSAEEQHSLIAYLRKLDAREPQRVERLQQYYMSAAATTSTATTPKPEEAPDKKEENVKLATIESDDDDYAVEEVFKSVTQKVKEDQTRQEMNIGKKSLEETKSTPEPETPRETPKVNFTSINMSSASDLLALVHASIQSTSSVTPAVNKGADVVASKTQPRSFGDRPEAPISNIEALKPQIQNASINPMQQQSSFGNQGDHRTSNQINVGGNQDINEPFNERPVWERKSNMMDDIGPMGNMTDNRGPLSNTSDNRGLLNNMLSNMFSNMLNNMLSNMVNNTGPMNNPMGNMSDNRRPMGNISYNRGPMGNMSVNRGPMGNMSDNGRPMGNMTDNRGLLSCTSDSIGILSNTSDNRVPMHNPMGNMSDNRRPMGSMSDNRGTMGNVSDNRGLMGRMPDNRGPMSDILDNRGPMGNISENRVPMGNMSANRGPMGNMSDNRGPMGNMPDNRGLTGNMSSNRSLMCDMPYNRGPMGGGPMNSMLDNRGPMNNMMDNRGLVNASDNRGPMNSSMGQRGGPFDNFGRDQFNQGPRGNFMNGRMQDYVDSQQNDMNQQFGNQGNNFRGRGGRGNFGGQMRGRGRGYY